MAENGEAKFETFHKRKNGSVIPFEVHSKVINFNDENAVLSVLRDVTLRKEMERKSENLNKELERRVYERTIQLNDVNSKLMDEIEDRKKTEMELEKAKLELSKTLELEKNLSELKSRFISMVSHEYRTPLTIILSSTHLLQNFYEKRNDAKFKKHILNIGQSVKSMNRLLEDVLALGRTELKDIEIKVSEFRLLSILTDVIEEIKESDKNEHTISLDTDNPELLLSSDKSILKHILMNLLTNAVKFSPPRSEIVLKVTEADNAVSISVSDEGIGIPEADQKDLFEPFHRSGNTGSISGTGIGLTIVKRYVDALSGSISVKSKLNRGSTFYCTIPKILY